MKEIWLLQHFLYDFKGNFLCTAFCSFGAMLSIVNLLIKRIPLLFVFLVCLSTFDMSHYLYKIADLKDILC